MPACPGHVVCGEFSNFVSAEELTEPPELLLPGNMLTYVTLLTTRHSPKLNLNEPPELLLPGNMLTYVTLLTTRHSPKLNLNEWLCLSFASGAETTAVIERTNNILDRNEALLNVDLCREAMILELMRWVKHGAWKRGKLSDASNVFQIQMGTQVERYPRWSD